MTATTLSTVTAPGDRADYWSAVVGRDHTYDGRFVYAVRSTGIYCRPSCPARRPAPDQVRFFGAPAAARAAGYRACRRCQPDAPAERQPSAIVERACRLLEAEPERAGDLADLSRRLGVAPTSLQRAFRRITGITPRQYADAARLGQLKGHLQRGETVTTALYEAGYGSSSRLYERAPTQLGMTPATYGRGGAGATIRFTVVSCRLGQLLVAATERGLCAIRLGDDADQLAAELDAEFPAAQRRRDDAGLGEWVRALLAHLNGQPLPLDLPLDIRATAFQRRVWTALQAIPAGERRSYGAVAAAIGQPTATRAVARACASNPVALTIPCHRVVREDGDLGGYRWGSARKAALLAGERAASDRVE